MKSNIIAQMTRISNLSFVASIKSAYNSRPMTPALVHGEAFCSQPRDEGFAATARLKGSRSNEHPKGSRSNEQKRPQ